VRRLSQLRRERVFKVVGEFAEVLVSTGGRVTFERVHGATHTTHDLGIIRTAFQLQAFFVERLQKLLRALKEEFFQLGCPFFRKEAQALTSIRW